MWTFGSLDPVRPTIYFGGGSIFSTMAARLAHLAGASLSRLECRRGDLLQGELRYKSAERDHQRRASQLNVRLMGNTLSATLFFQISPPGPAASTMSGRLVGGNRWGQAAADRKKLRTFFRRPLGSQRGPADHLTSRYLLQRCKTQQLLIDN